MDWETKLENRIWTHPFEFVKKRSWFELSKLFMSWVELSYEKKSWITLWPVYPLYSYRAFCVINSVRMERGIKSNNIWVQSYALISSLCRSGILYSTIHGLPKHGQGRKTMFNTEYFLSNLIYYNGKSNSRRLNFE